MKQLNLDQKAAQYAQHIVDRAKVIPNVKKPIDTLERLVTKTLGVLQEQGVYAALLFLYSRTSDEAKIATAIRGPLFRLLQDREAKHAIPIFQNKNVPADDADAKTALAFYSQEVCENLDTLLLVRDLYEQTLIYARYGAKAAGGSS
jgi:hypothetical protein